MSPVVLGVLMGFRAISWANARKSFVPCGARAGEGSLRCRAEEPSSRGAVDGGWGLLASVKSGLCIHKAPSKKIPTS